MAVELAFCVAGIYACFLTWGVLQERVTTTAYGSADQPAYFKSFIVLNFLQAVMACAIGSIYLLVIRRGTLGPRSPAVLARYLLVAVFNSLASPFGYAALRHIDYPTMILGKSCKLIPVMGMAVLLHRASFPRHQYLSVAMVTLGVSLFMLLHDQERPSSKGAKGNSIWGLFLLAINLAIDGVTNSTQDAMVRKFKVTGQQMMVMMNACSALLMWTYLSIPAVSGGELAVATAFVKTHPAVLKDMALFALCGALGQVFIFHTLGRFGSLLLVTITVTRKMFSIILSVLMYNHHISLAQWGAVAVVFAGIAVEAYGKRNGKSKGKKGGATAVGAKVEKKGVPDPLPVVVGGDAAASADSAISSPKARPRTGKRSGKSRAKRDYDGR
ncbi:UDP-galactose transporter [Allomyces arbusculus]|nr:UDP-galactose transporter [Allomyces arbusculus]